MDDLSGVRLPLSDGAPSARGEGVSRSLEGALEWVTTGRMGEGRRGSGGDETVLSEAIYEFIGAPALSPSFAVYRHRNYREQKADTKFRNCPTIGRRGGH